MILILKWAGWAVSALSLLLIFFGFIAYMLGNIQILGAHYWTYFIFGQNLLFSAILLVLLNISLKDNK
jgi:predicted anti-sigma-YlaC factor YlaD